MGAARIEKAAVRLSICIPTFNRAAYLDETLASVIGQASEDCEIVVSDNASTDGTEEVVRRHAQRFNRLRYVKQPKNVGLDRNFDNAVIHAQGEYCWLLGDDDLLKPGAIPIVLDALRDDQSLLLVNGEYWDLRMSQLLVSNFFGIHADQRYGKGDFDRLFNELGKCSICISCFVMKRAVWLSRSRERYFGSMWIHVGVTFQEPLPGETRAIAQPLVRLRWGNEKEWLWEAFEIFYIRWPKLIWSLPLSNTTKKNHCANEPWRRLRYLLPLRATGAYSLPTLKRWVWPHLRTARDKIVPLLVLLVPPAIARRCYDCYSLIAGLPNSLQAVSRANSTLPESLYPLIGLSKT